MKGGLLQVLNSLKSSFGNRNSALAASAVQVHLVEDRLVIADVLNANIVGD